MWRFVPRHTATNCGCMSLFKGKTALFGPNVHKGSSSQRPRRFLLFVEMPKLIFLQITRRGVFSVVATKKIFPFLCRNSGIGVYFCTFSRPFFMFGPDLDLVATTTEPPLEEAENIQYTPLAIGIRTRANLCNLTHKQG